MKPSPDERGSVLVQTTIATLAIFGLLVPLALQLVVYGFGDVVSTLVAQGSVDALRKNPDDAAAAERRGRELADRLGGGLFVDDLEIELRVIEDGRGRRAEAIVRGRARPLLGIDVLSVRARATGSVEGFRPDLDGGS